MRLSDVQEKCLIPETSYACLAGHPISTVVTSPTGSTFFAATANAALIINTKNFSVERELDLVGVTCAQFNHNGSLLIFSNNKGSLGILDLNRGEMLATWSPHAKGVVRLMLCADETSVWSLGRDGHLVQSSLLRPGDQLWKGEVPDGSTLAGDFALSPDSQHVLYGSDNGALVYKVGEEGEMTRVLAIHAQSPVTAVHWSTGTT